MLHNFYSIIISIAEHHIICKVLSLELYKNLRICNIQYMDYSIRYSSHSCFGTYNSSHKIIFIFSHFWKIVVKSIYDKFTYNDHYEEGERFSLQFPEKWCEQHRYVIANYIFKKKFS